MTLLGHFLSLAVLHMEYLHGSLINLNMQDIDNKKGSTYYIVGKFNAGYSKSGFLDCQRNLARVTNWKVPNMKSCAQHYVISQNLKIFGRK